MSSGSEKPELANPPMAGDYWTDGSRLVQVIGLTKNGDYLVEDVSLELTLELPIVELTKPGVWKLVRRGNT